MIIDFNKNFVIISSMITIDNMYEYLKKIKIEHYDLKFKLN